MSDLAARVAMLERMVTALTRRQGSSIAFSRSTAPPVDTGSVQTIQGQMDALSKRDGMPVLMNFGFSSAMPVGGDKVVGYLDGTRSSPVVIATGHQTYRYTGLITGESVLYDMWGRNFKASSSGLQANCGGVPMVVNGDLHVTGAVIAGYGGGDQVGLETHIHIQGSDSHGDTEAAISPPVAGS